MEKMIGFIGMGNMGQAIVKGILAAGFATADNVIASRQNVDLLQKLQTEF
ncbi:NAD(P)-binding domain-containing protein, partial [Jeotgalibaca porci]